MRFLLAVPLVLSSAAARADSIAYGGHVDLVPSKADHPLAAGAGIELEHAFGNYVALRADVLVDGFHMTPTSASSSGPGS